MPPEKKQHNTVCQAKEQWRQRRRWYPRRYEGYGSVVRPPWEKVSVCLSVHPHVDTRTARLDPVAIAPPPPTPQPNSFFPPSLHLDRDGQALECTYLHIQRHRVGWYK